jgi:hypothetical protein
LNFDTHITPNNILKPSNVEQAFIRVEELEVVSDAIGKVVTDAVSFLNPVLNLSPHD